MTKIVDAGYADLRSIPCCYQGIACFDAAGDNKIPKRNYSLTEVATSFE